MGMLANTYKTCILLRRKEDAHKHAVKTHCILCNLEETEGGDFCSQMKATMLLNSSRHGQVLDPGNTLKKIAMAILLLQQAH